MGISPFKSCATNTSIEAPNPDPSQWELADVQQFDRAYVLQVRYKNCNNYEGMKIMVYKGQYTHSPDSPLDPHFADTGDSPVARFRPDMQGAVWAVNFAKSL